MTDVVIKKYRILVILFITFCSSCRKPIVVKEENKIFAEIEISNKIYSENETLEPITLNADFTNRKKIVYNIKDIKWNDVNIDNGIIVILKSDYFKHILTFNIDLTAIEIPIILELYKKEHKLEFRVIQQFNTVYEDKFIFGYDKKYQDWILEQAYSIIYTNQSKDLVCPYIVKDSQTVNINTKDMKMRDCYEKIRN